MVGTIKVLSITVQPDALKKLEGENDYDLVRLKRAIIRAEYQTGTAAERFTMNLDFRARILAVNYDGDAKLLAEIANEVLVALSLLNGGKFATPAGGPREGVARLQVRVADSDQALGFLHVMKEQGAPKRRPATIL